MLKLKIMEMIFTCLRALVAVTFLLFPLQAYPQGSVESLGNGFRKPPLSAMPRTWWHWTNGNITMEGITKDLEWMKRVGIGGMQLADVASGQGQTVEKKITFMSPEWLDAVKHAASEAGRLNLEMAIFSSAGWSLTGGPWVKPEQAMKKLVWSETRLMGPAEFTGRLPSPPDIEGPIRNLPRGARVSDSDPRFYRDCIVLAFPTPADESGQVNPSGVNTSRGVVEPVALLDDDLATSLAIKADREKKTAWIEYVYEKPFTARSVTLANRAGIPVGKVMASHDGVTYETLAVLPGAQLYRSGKVQTITFPAATARIFRFEFTGAPLKPAEVMSESTTLPDSVYTFGEIKIHSCARVNRWEDKAGFYHLFNYEPVATIDVSSGSAIDPSKVIDITDYMAADGSLNWKVPSGSWTVMRFGYSLTGSKNRPAVPSGLGYEVDKLSREHSGRYIMDYLAPISESLGTLFGNSLSHVLLDSWEAGMQNWTDSMLSEFRARREYDLVPFLPALAGWIVGNNDISDRVLWDFRRTLADMFASNHFGVITEYLNGRGVKTYGEVSGVSLEILEDALLCKKYVDIPMGEFWYRDLHPSLMYYQDIRGAASAAHIYGKNIVAAESFTGGGFESPYSLKKIGDYWFTQGVNRIVFHTSAHQPLDTKPGNTMVGTHINRNITWAEQAAPFMTYLARCSFMLQQGTFVADILYLLDEGAPSTMPIWGQGLVPAPPEGYDFDYINADALLNNVSVSPEGFLQLPDGAKYSLLVLPESGTMTLPVLKKISQLVKEGAIVSGPVPERTPGMTGYPAGMKMFRELVSETWGDLDGISRTNRKYGKGTVSWGSPLKTLLIAARIMPDVEYGKPLDQKLDWIHRKSDEADIYFIVNSSDRPMITDVRFRVAGMVPEFWDPATGKASPASYKSSDARTIVPVKLGERESVFIVFRRKAEMIPVIAGREEPAMTKTIDNQWTVSFPPGLGAPDQITLDTLKSLTSVNDDGVKYFSGTAVYSAEFTISKSFIDDASRIVIDLGAVGDLAELTVNGEKAGLLWKPPFTADITGLVRKGTNRIEIGVTNQWTNRLSGDMKLPMERKILKSTLFVRPGRLNDSGLTGPVRIIKYN